MAGSRDRLGLLNCLLSSALPQRAYPTKRFPFVQRILQTNQSASIHESLSKKSQKKPFRIQLEEI